MQSSRLIDRVIPVKTQESKLCYPTCWVPASVGLTNYDTANWARGVRPLRGSHLYPRGSGQDLDDIEKLKEEKNES